MRETGHQCELVCRSGPPAWRELVTWRPFRRLIGATGKLTPTTSGGGSEKQWAGERETAPAYVHLIDGLTRRFLAGQLAARCPCGQTPARLISGRSLPRRGRPGPARHGTTRHATAHDPTTTTMPKWKSDSVHAAHTASFGQRLIQHVEAARWRRQANDYGASDTTFSGSALANLARSCWEHSDELPCSGLEPNRALCTL